MLEVYKYLNGLYPDIMNTNHFQAKAKYLQPENFPHI